jgi:hypothetical protein
MNYQIRLLVVEIRNIGDICGLSKPVHRKLPTIGTGRNLEYQIKLRTFNATSEIPLYHSQNNKLNPIVV